MTVKRLKKPVTFETEKGTYKVVKRLGKGGCSVVHLARDLGSAEYVAIKVAKKDYESIRAINEEARILSNLDHKGIVGLQSEGRKGKNSFGTENKHLANNFIVMNYVSKSRGKAFDLFDYIMGAKGTLGEEHGRVFLK